MEKNLQSAQAIAKLKELIGDTGTCMLITSGKSGKHATRPMAVADTDEEGNLWFFANKQSNKIKDIEIDHHVQIVFAHPGKNIFIDIHGRAGIVEDEQYIKDKWNPLVKAWFPGGISDPDLCLLKIKADEANYWDTENSKVGHILKIAVSAVTGKKLEEGVHGELRF